MASRSGTDQHRSLTSSHSCRVKELVSLHGLLTFFFLLGFLPAECSQNGLTPGVAAKTRKGCFLAKACGVMRHHPHDESKALHKQSATYDADQCHLTVQFTYAAAYGVF